MSKPLGLTKKELEDKILKFLQSETYEYYLRADRGSRMWFRKETPIQFSIRKVYLGTDAGSYGDAQIFNSVLGAMYKAGMLTENYGSVYLCQDLKLEAIERAEKSLAAAA